MTTLTYRGRLPGVVCQAALPPDGEQPLRLDVAAFVGFAERGPLDTPVAVEDSSQYAAIFGGDLQLARESGRPVYAHLPDAVRTFFDNGGRRCYAVRVAGPDARPNYFMIPGLVALTPEGTHRAVVAPAAWVGGWSDSMSVGAQLRSQPLPFQGGLTASADEALSPPFTGDRGAGHPRSRTGRSPAHPSGKSTRTAPVVSNRRRSPDGARSRDDAGRSLGG